MKLKRLTLILLCIALLAGTAAAFGARSYIENAVARYRAELDARYEKIKVVVAAEDVAAGSILDPSNVVSREVPKAFLHRDAITVSQWPRYAGRTARTALTRGAPVLLSQLRPPRAEALADSLESGTRALTVPVDQISSISGMLTPGDRVDILLTVERAGKPVTIPFLKNIAVLATGFRRDDESTRPYRAQGPERFNTVTILVTTEQAARVVHAREVGTLTVVLRASGDETDDWPERVTLAALLGEAEPRPVAVRAKRYIEVILGGQGTLQQ